MTSEQTKRDMVLTRLFDAPVEEVWKAWSDPEYVMQWWGPKGFTAPLARMDFREGGTSLVCMRAPAEYGGMELYNTWTYHTIEPQRRIEFTQHFTDAEGRQIDPAQIGLPPGVPPAVRHVITFRPAGDRRTEMTVTEQSYSTDQAHDLSKAGMAECLDKMAEIWR